MKREIGVRTGFAAVAAYLLASIATGVLVAIVSGGADATPDAGRRIDALIDGSTAAYVLVSIALVVALAFVPRQSRRDIFLEREGPAGSPRDLFYPLALVGAAAWALATVPWGAYATSDILLVVVAASAIAFNEEVVTRGFLLVGLRNGGVAEWKVWLITTVVFSLLHAVNLLGGANITQLLVTLASGTLLYASRRVAGNLVVPIVIHATYDVGFFLLGGVYAPDEDLPSGVLDVHLGAFLLQAVAAIVFVTLGRRLLGREQPRR